MATDTKTLKRVIGERLRERRLARGWSQEEVARRVQISRDFVSRCERGDREPSLHVLGKLAALFEVEPGYFLVMSQSTGRPALSEIEALLLPRTDEELRWVTEWIRFHLANPFPVGAAKQDTVAKRRRSRGPS